MAPTITIDPKRLRVGRQAGRSMRVLLVTPPYHAGVVEAAGVWMNVGFAYIAGELRKHGHDVEIYDAMSLWHNEDTVRKEIARRKPEVVGVTAVTASSVAAEKVCAAAKEELPGVITVLGNVHPTFMWRETLNGHPEVDFIVRGEGEVTMVELCNCLAENGDPSRVAGVAYRKNGEPVSTSRRPIIADLDALTPSWDLIDWPTYTYRPNEGSRLAVISSSRGCQMQCSFCSQQQFWRRTWRGHTPEHFVGTIEHLAKTFGVNVAMLSDETPTVDEARWQRILDLLIERDLGVELLMETRVDHIMRDAPILDRYHKAGISHIYVGVESAHQETLDLFHKDINVEQSRAAIQAINAAGMVSETSFVLGMPDETPEHIAATIELAKHYAPDLAFFLAIAPWPYSELYPQLKSHIAVDDYSRFNLVEAVVKPDAMTIPELNEYLARAAHSFYGDKLRRLHELPKDKQTFMIKVMKILANHSYLAARMKGLAAEMPPEVRRALDALDAIQPAA